MINRRLKYSLVLIGVSVFVSSSAVAQSIIYVNQAATGANTGTSWADAFTYLQDALQAAHSGDEVWVAAGTYRPDQGTGITPGDREASFHIPGGVSLYGGFVGEETDRDHRDWELNETVLSGDLLGNDDDILSFDNPLRSDNTLQIALVVDLYSDTSIDGFTITGGMGTSIGSYEGSGISVESYNPSGPPGRLTIANSVISENVAYRGSVFISFGPTTDGPAAVIESSEFSRNRGGLYVSNGKTLVRDVQFIHNTSTSVEVYDEDVFIVGSSFSNSIRSSGGAVRFDARLSDNTLYMWDTIFAQNSGVGVHIEGADFISINNIFTGNSASEGGAVVVSKSRAHIVNNVFAFNDVRNQGGAVESFKSDTQISNSIFWENTAPEDSDVHSRYPPADTIQISNSIVQQALQSYVLNHGGILSGDPLFEDADGPDNIPGTLDDDFSLTYFSPAIDAGANDSLFADFWDLDMDGDFNEPWPYDFDGNDRIINNRSGTPVVDLGPFEFNGLGPEAVDDAEDLPEDSPGLSPAYPNPFNTGTTITYSLPHSADVSIEVFDLLGKRVRLLDSGFKPSGEHEVNFDASDLSTGIYFYTLKAGGFSQTRKMVVVK